MRPVRRRRGHGRTGVTLLLASVLGAAWWVTSGAPGVPEGALPVLPSRRAVEQETTPPALPPPSPDVVALADAAHLAPEGRELFYAAQPEVLDASAFVGRCAGGSTASPADGGGAVGCYVRRRDGTGAIVVYRPADPRLWGAAVETAAHETLHAAWDRLTAEDQAALTPLLEAVVATLPADDPIHAQIAGSVGATPSHRPTELFAYVGTQIWREPGLDPVLEAAYARFVADRSALVAVHTAWVATLDAMDAEIAAASQAVTASELTNAHARARYDADAASLAHYRQTYEAKLSEVAAMAPADRARLQLSWVWWDGTDLPMAPAEETLAAAEALLVRDDAALPARLAEIVAQEAAAAAERARVEALVADLTALRSQLSPRGAAGS